jgi:hypothetical protein
MNKLGQYNNDERGHYTFNYTDTNDSKHVSISFRAEPDYDLDIIFAEIRNFLIASGHDIEGQIGELGIDGGSYDDGDYANPMEQSWAEDSDEIHAMKQYQSADKFSMDHLPNNGWPFGDLTSASIPALTTADFASLTVTDLQTLSTQGYADWAGINKYATMAPIMQEQIQSWKMPAPGTLGGAKVEFK